MELVHSLCVIDVDQILHPRRLWTNIKIKVYGVTKHLNCNVCSKEFETKGGLQSHTEH